ncbi:MAG: carbohydrate kinase family protein [Chromatiales bacterium]|nr:carbohydrate kinase family protein [Chromatiales bacterium]
MTALICGSIAYDNIMVFPGRFRDHILPDQIHILNVAFLVPEMRREFGGCAGNIAYTLTLLGEAPLVMATVGSDFSPYQARLDSLGISRRFVMEVSGTLTAQAYITTDLDDNQITAFHPGAMDHAHVQAVPRDAGIRIGMVSPDGRQGMLDHAEQFAAAGIPFMFDPGQGLPMFDGEALRHFIELARWVAVNDYEAQLLKERTGMTEQQIASSLDALVITRGAEGSRILTGGEVLEIPAVRAREVLDPTGCGDAYRAGLLFGLLNGLDWPATGRLAALLGSRKIEHRGTQNHHLSLNSVSEAFRAEFGHALEV